MFKYGLPSPHLILQLKPSKGRWKNLVTNTVLNHWERSLKTSALEKSSMLLLTADVNGLSLRKEHPVWQWTESNMRDTERARIKSRMITGTYILQANRARFNNYDVDPTCPLCGDGSEDIHHMIASCTAMKSIRTRYLPSLVSVFDLHTQCRLTSDPAFLTSLVMNCSLASRYGISGPEVISKLERFSRLYICTAPT
jgi:hypothetical protein